MTSSIGEQKGRIAQRHHRAGLNKVVLLLIHEELDVGFADLLSFDRSHHQPLIRKQFAEGGKGQRTTTTEFFAATFAVITS